MRVHEFPTILNFPFTIGHSQTHDPLQDHDWVTTYNTLHFPKEEKEWEKTAGGGTVRLFS